LLPRAQLLLRVPVPEWLPAAPSGEFVVEFKWLLRKACLALGAAALVCAACTFRNVEKENLRYDCHMSATRCMIYRTHLLVPHVCFAADSSTQFGNHLSQEHHPSLKP